MPEPAAPPAAGERILMRLLLAGLFTYAMGQTLIFAVLGPIVREIGLPEIALGLTISCSSLAFTLSASIWGAASDRIGRMPPILFGLVGYAVVTILFSSVLELGMAGVLAPAVVLPLMIGLRMTLTASAGGLQPASTAYMADRTSEADRAKGVATVGAAFGLGSVFGPVFGGALSTFGLLAPLYVSAGIAFVLAAGIWAYRKNVTVRPFTGAQPRLKLTDRRLLPFSLLMWAIFIVFAAVQQTTAFYIQDLLSLTSTETATVAGFVIGAMALAQFAAQMAVTRLPHVPVRLLIQLGIGFMFAGLTVAALAPGIWWLGGSYMLMGLGQGLSQPGVMSAASLAVSANEQGAAAGRIASSIGLGFFVGPLLGTGLYTVAPTAVLAFASGFMSLVLVAVLVAPVVRARRAR